MMTIDPPSCVSAEVAKTLRSSMPRFVRRARELVGLAGGVDVLLTDDRTMRRLNREFRGKNKPTDVLSFPAASMPGLPEAMGHAGDLAISVEIAERQAEERGHGLETELRVLLLHGMLHLHGMDHESDDGEMAEREAALRKRLRLPDGLIGRTMGSTEAKTAAKRPGRARA